MNAPSPGRAYVAPYAVKTSEATRKNHPFVQERIELYTSFGTTAGRARRRNRSQSRTPKEAAASSRSCGIVERDSYTPKAMFQAIEVKIRKTTATSRPTGLPWNVETKNTRAAGKNPRIGMLWRTSRSGSITTAARLFVAAVVPKATAKKRGGREGAPKRGTGAPAGR